MGNALLWKLAMMCLQLREDIWESRKNEDHGIQSLITSWQIDWETMEIVTLLFLGSKITADGDCIQEIKRCLLPGRKALTNLDNILKSRHYFADKGPSSQSYGFPSSHVWM